MCIKLISFGFSLLLSAVTFASPTPYLPIGSDSHLELQIDHLFVLTRGTPMKKPYSVKEIELALDQIEQSNPALYGAIDRQLDNYRGNNKISRFGLTARLSSGEDMHLANQRGLMSDEYAQGLFEAVWRPNHNTLVQAGVDYRVNAGDLTSYNTFVAFSAGNLQLDLGYREHWYSPFKHSAQLISTNAPMGPSVTLSTIIPVKRWWNISVDLFYTQLNEVEKSISYQGAWHDGSPHLLGTHLSIEPLDGWKLGFNRILQFGGGPRKASIGDILSGFFDPAGNDNAYNQDQRDTELGDQLASLTTSYSFNTELPMQIYAELAAEDTQGGSNYSLGNQATNLGIFWPQIGNNIALRYEYNRWKTAWYTNHNYAYGNTNNGYVFGHYAADQRTFGHGIPAEIHKVSVDYFTSVNASWSASITKISNRDNIQYDRAYELQLQNRRGWQTYRIESKLALGESVFSENYGHLSMTIFW